MALDSTVEFPLTLEYRCYIIYNPWISQSPNSTVGSKSFYLGDRSFDRSSLQGQMDQPWSLGDLSTGWWPSLGDLSLGWWPSLGDLYMDWWPSMYREITQISKLGHKSWNDDVSNEWSPRRACGPHYNLIDH